MCTVIKFKRGPFRSQPTSLGPNGEIQEPISFRPEAAWRISGRIQADRSAPAYSSNHRRCWWRAALLWTYTSPRAPLLFSRLHRVLESERSLVSEDEHDNRAECWARGTADRLLSDDTLRWNITLISSGRWATSLLMLISGFHIHRTEKKVKWWQIDLCKNDFAGTVLSYF